MANKKTQEAVFIFLQFSQGKLDTDRGMDAVFALEDSLQEVVEEHRVGKRGLNFDGMALFGVPAFDLLDQTYF